MTLTAIKLVLFYNANGNTLQYVDGPGPEVGLLSLHFFYICRHHPTLKFKPHATDDERYVWGIDGVPLINLQILCGPQTQLIIEEISLSQIRCCHPLYLYLQDAPDR